MRPSRLPQAALLGLAATLTLGCGAEPSTGSPATAPAWRQGASEQGTFQARWRPEPAPIPVNEPFELELELLAPDGGPLEGELEVYVHANMPAHRHGMLRRPVATRRPDGGFHVRGMLLHMAGHWQLLVDVVREGHLDQARFDVELE